MNVQLVRDQIYYNALRALYRIWSRDQMHVHILIQFKKDILFLNNWIERGFPEHSYLKA